MTKKTTIINKTSIYESPRVTSKSLMEVNEGDVFKYKRIKRKNGITWYEIYLENNTIGYLNFENAFLWELVKITPNDTYIKRNDNGEKKLHKKRILCEYY